MHGSNESRRSALALFFHSVFAALVQDVSQYLSLSHSCVFAVHTVLTSTKDSQIKSRLVFDVSIELHTLGWISVVFGFHLLCVPQLITEAYV